MINEIKDEILDKLVGDSSEIIIETNGTIRFLFGGNTNKKELITEKIDSEPIKSVQETAILDKVGDVEGYKFQESDKEFLETLSKEALISAVINRDNIIENIKDNLEKHIGRYSSLMSVLSVQTNDNDTRNELNHLSGEILNYDFKEWKGIAKHD